MFAGGSFNVGVAGGVLVNTGTISVGNGDVATIGSLVNAGQVTVGTGGVLTLAQYNASPGGRVVETNATLNLDGSLTLAALVAVTRSGGIVNIGGSLDLGGGTLALGTGTALVQLRDTGVIADGTITDAGGGMVFYGGIGELLNVTYRGLVNLTPALSNLIVQGLTVTGTAGTGPGAVNVLGAGSTLTFQGSQIFDNGTINFGSNAETDTLMISDPTGAGVVLTLGGNANLQQRGAMAQIVIGRGLGDALVNNGLIAANQPGGDMIVLGGTFTNSGRVVVAVGDTLTSRGRSGLEPDGRPPERRLLGDRPRFHPRSRDGQSNPQSERGDGVERSWLAGSVLQYDHVQDHEPGADAELCRLSRRAGAGEWPRVQRSRAVLRDRQGRHGQRYSVGRPGRRGRDSADLRVWRDKRERDL